MSRRQHPIDDAFRKKLKNHASEPPMHLWEGIEHQRNAQQKIRQLKRQRALLAALLIVGLFAAGLSWYSHAAHQPQLGSFPVWETEAPIAKSEMRNGKPEIERSEMPYQRSESQKPKSKIQQNQTFSRNAGKKRLNAPIAFLAKEIQPLERSPEQLSMDSKKKNFQPKGDVAAARSQLPSLPQAFQNVRALAGPQPIHASGCEDFSDRHLRFYFDAMAAPGFAERTLSPRGLDFTSYAHVREETELPRFMYSAALRLSAVTHSGIALRTGLNYSEINERFEHTIENEVRTIITNVYGQNGEIIGTDTTIEASSRRVVANNNYRMFDIPMLIGYEEQFKNLTLSLNGGAYVNIYFEPEGEFLSPENNRPVSFSNDANDEAYPAFREDLGIGWYGSLGVQYRVSPRLSLLVEPHVRMYPRSFTREDFMVDQKYLTAGVFVGLRHQFQL
jgi:hypothetical protein